MKSRTRCTYAAIVLLLISGCAFSKDSGKNKETIPAEEKAATEELIRLNESERNAVLANDEVHLRFEETEERNRYKLVVEWPERVPLIKLFINNVLKSSLKSSPYSEILTGGTAITVYIEACNSRGITISKVTKTTIVPLDYTISSAMTLEKDKDIKAARIFLDNQSLIHTNGFALSLTADEILSDSAIVTTKFSPNEGQTRDDRLLTNSSITIQAKKLVGNINFILHGLDGMDGRNAEQLDRENPRPIPADGQQGSPEHTEIRTRNSRVGGGMDYSVCISRASDGTPGQDAPPATNGEDGGRGGNPGNLSLVVEDYQDAIVDVQYHIGIGGKGGAGGPAIKGGRGGPAGESKGTCQKAKPGPDGRNSAAGSPGKNGNSGDDPVLILPSDKSSKYKIFVRPY